VRRLAPLSAVAAALLVALSGGPAHAQGVQPNGYQVVAQASVLQWTYDFPTANFHPQADNELPYAEVDGDPSRAHALSSVYWPGAAGGNFGSLVSLLVPPGVPPPPNSILDALNDPVRAEAATGATTQQATTSPTGTTMKASVVPTQPSIAQEADAVTSWAGLSLGPSGSLGASSAVAKHTLDQDGKLVATAESFVANVDLGGMFKAGSITASATEQSVAGATPTGSSTITVHDLTIGGQRAYVDGAGVHMGQPGKPAGSAAVDAASKALAGAGMQIYFTTPAKITIAGVAYDYSASILVYWAPPGDDHGDVFTFSFGGAAIGISASPGTASSPGGGGSGETIPPSVSDLSLGGGSLPATPTSPALQLPTPASAVGSPTAPSSSQKTGRAATGQLATATRPTAVQAWWLALLALATLAGIVLLPRVPALLTTAASSDCIRERPNPIRRL